MESMKSISGLLALVLLICIIVYIWVPSEILLNIMITCVVIIIFLRLAIVGLEKEKQRESDKKSFLDRVKEMEETQSKKQV